MLGFDPLRQRTRIEEQAATTAPVLSRSPHGGTLSVGSRPDRRVAPRYDITVPIDLGPARKGITRNVSSSGVLFEVEGTGGMGPGEPVRFRLRLGSVPGPLCCEGRIVRLQPANGRCVVATTIEVCWFE